MAGSPRACAALARTARRSLAGEDAGRLRQSAVRRRRPRGWRFVRPRRRYCSRETSSPAPAMEGSFRSTVKKSASRPGSKAARGRADAFRARLASRSRISAPPGCPRRRPARAPRAAESSSADDTRVGGRLPVSRSVRCYRSRNICQRRAEVRRSVGPMPSPRLRSVVGQAQTLAPDSAQKPDLGIGIWMACTAVKSASRIWCWRSKVKGPRAIFRLRRPRFRRAAPKRACEPSVCVDG